MTRQTSGRELPSGTTNIFLSSLAERLSLKNFRGVFMRDALPTKPLMRESGIMNFDTSDNPGSHWVSWYIDVSRKEKYYYFDSFGTAVPDELRKYLGQKKIMRSDFMIQGTNTDICGELCLAFILAMDTTGETYKKIISEFRK